MTAASLVLRPATSADTADLERLAALDSARPLDGEVMLAHDDGGVRAALSLETGRAVAEPFYPRLAAVGERSSRRSWRRPARATRPALA